jgi:hypothetical protein
MLLELRENFLEVLIILLEVVEVVMEQILPLEMLVE